MFLTMALDSSHFMGSVAVARGDEILCEILFDASDTHSATLLPAVDICLKTAHLRIEDIDKFSVVTGPGSFTGLRIGLSTIKAFAAVRKRPVVSASSLEVLAAAFPYVSSTIAPIIDARRGEVYLGLYNTQSGQPSPILEPVSIQPDKIAELLVDKNRGAPVIFCGTGVKKYRNIIEANMPDGSRFSIPCRAIPRASLLIAVTMERAPVKYEELSGMEPLYIRPPDAKLPASMKLNPGGGKK